MSIVMRRGNPEAVRLVMENINVVRERRRRKGGR